MDLTGIPTPCMDWTSTNLVDSWKKFQQHVQLIFDGPLKEKDETVKISYLLIWVGDKGCDVYNTWTLSNDNKKKLDTYYKRFKAYVQPKLNPVFSRFKFNNEVQGQQSIEQLAKDCQYHDADEMIRDRIVFGTNSAKIREKLINEGDKLTLDKAIQIAQNHEYSQEQLKSMGTTSQEVHAITSRPPPGNRDSHKTSKTGHSTSQPEPKRVVHALNKSGVSYEQNQAFTHVTIGPNNVPVKCKLDTGSQVNVIPVSTYKQLGVADQLSSSSNLSGYAGSPVKKLGSCKVAVKFKDIFEGLGLFPGECTIHIDPDAIPAIHPPRRIPQALGDRFKTELDRIEKLLVIAKVDTPTHWVNSMVVVEKPSGALRSCLDPRDLNKVIHRPHYPLKTLNDILPELAGARYFTKLDARSGYWTIKLDDDSSYLTTFNTPYGRYRFLRLPFGLKSAQDEFQRKIDYCYAGLKGVVAIVDDILVYGKTRAEHDSNLKAALQRTREMGIKLNDEKLDVGKTQVEYFGHLLSEDGVKPDPKKVSAVKDMKPPENRNKLETVLGMVNYLSKFAPNLADTTSPMRQLLSKRSEFVWGPAQEESFAKVKDIITRSPGRVLAYFDPRKDTVLQVDASKFGLGATLLQEGKPVSYASKSLTPSEINYAQIEKEMLAILFGYKHFHHYVYGREVCVQTDHKPLVSIMQKSILTAPARLQRMILQLQRYNLKLVHVPGKQIPVADTLSRKYLPHTMPELSKGIEAQLHLVHENMQVSDCRLEQIRLSTESDPQFQTLTKFILEGWPDLRRNCLDPIKEYWNFRDELSVENGLIMKGLRIVIPHDLRTELLKILHVGHTGVEKTLRRARDIVFWPGLTKDVTDLILNCNVCLELRNSNPKEPLQSHEIPSYPWQTIASYLFLWDDKDYVLFVDYYSRYFGVFRLTNTHSSTIISKCKEVFARYGIPENFVLDNGPQYSSYEFADFSKEWNFQHVTSSPRYPRSNGLAERTVQTIKGILTKCKADRQDINLAILTYRTTPLDIGLSPSQLLMSRRLRSNIPTVQESLKPFHHDTDKIRVKLQVSHDKSKVYHDRSALPLKPLKSGDSVRVQLNDKKWTPAIIMQPHGNRSYLVKTPAGSLYRCNRRFLHKTKEAPQPEELALPQYDVFKHEPLPDDTPNLNSGNDVQPGKNPDIGNSPKPPEQSKPYVTRSGRVVRQKIIPSM
ncbi:uncharacterized protein K02A2.6-like [Saccostrea cucullata]|uniref:uncharacterized protein K02A2.6-like n=1 Tax=Saccostrea cuccullata TaxID=36930 RepID=UPI002ECFE923